MKNKTNFFILSLAQLVMFFMLAGSCSKDDSTPTPTPAPTNNLPVLITTAASNISYTTANTGGNITSDGGDSVTARGVCWSSTNHTPAITDNKTTDGTGKGSFTSNLTGLTSSQTYYIRAYATNKNGTAYGSTMNFKTFSTGNLKVLVCDASQTNYFGGVEVFVYKSDTDRTNDVARSNYLYKSTTDNTDHQTIGAIFYSLPIAQYYVYCKLVYGSVPLTGTGDILVVANLTTSLSVIIQ